MSKDIKEKIFDYLNQLRDSGKVNMLEAPSHLQTLFKLEKKVAINVFWEWSDTL